MGMVFTDVLNYLAAFAFQLKALPLGVDFHKASKC